jgi:5-methylcytosine-specific restriction protein A
MICALCQRDVPALTDHHLVPKSRLKKGAPVPRVDICSGCHRQIHALFTNRELADEFNSVEKLRAEPRMAGFLNWIRKQDPSRHVRVRRAP